MPSVFGVYRGIYASLVDDPDFQQLSSHARHVLLTMRISKDAGPACIWRAYVSPIAERTGLSLGAVEKALAELSTSGWIEWDGAIIWIKNGLRYDPTFKLADPKHVKSVQKAIAALPKRQIVLNFCDYYKISRPFDAPSETLPRLGPPKPISETETETETDSISRRSDETTWPSVALLVAKYNQSTPAECPAVTKLSDGRKNKIKAYLMQFPEEVFWDAVFKEIHNSAFLRGLKPSNGHESFVASLDWLLTKGKDGTENAVKVYEGRYADREQNNGNRYPKL